MRRPKMLRPFIVKVSVLGYFPLLVVGYNNIIYHGLTQRYETSP